jgi:transposase-like protein
VSEVLPLMYLHGMSSGDFVPTLGEFFGSDAGLSASVITRLTKSWQEERERFANRSLADVDFVYCWADGVHFNVRLEEERLCGLVIVGARADGTKELVAIADDYRESTGILGGPAAGLQTPWDASPGGDRRRRGPGHVVGARRGVPRDPPPALLGPSC